MPSPWFSPNWREQYQRLLEQILKLEALAKKAGREIRPREKAK